MSPSLQTDIVQGDFSAGMSRDVSPPLISSAGAYDLINVLLDEDGTLYERGGSVYKSKEGLGSAGLTWAWDGYLKPGQRTVFANPSDFGVLGSDDESMINLGGSGLSEPKQSAALEDLLFIGGKAIYGGSRKTAVYSTGTVTVTNGSKKVTGSGTTWSTLVDAGMLFHIASERVYVVETINSTTELTLRDTYQGTGGGSKSYTLNPVWTIGGSDPYEEWDFVTVCANRIVVGLGNVIKFTEVNNPHTFTNSLGTTNEHTLPEGIQLVGVATVGQTVLAFTTAGVWTIDGLALDITDLNGNPQHRIQQLSRDIVGTGAAAIASSEQRLVVPAADGIFLMDGESQPQRISKPIDRLYRKRIAQGHKLGGAVVYRNHYFLPVLSSGLVTDLLVCRLDRPRSERGQTSYPWVRFSGDAGETTAFTVRNTTGAREPLLLGAQGRQPSRIVDCSGFFEPTSENAVDADGSSKALDLITRDIQTGAGTINRVRDLVTRYEMIALEATSEQPLLKFYYSSGDLIESDSDWDLASWDLFDWEAEDSSATFTALEGDAPAQTERDIHKCRVNKQFRFARFRIRRTGLASYSGIREFNLRVRPSQAVRR